MKKLTVFIMLFTISLPLAACARGAQQAPGPATKGSPAVVVSEGPEEANFRLFLSDQPDDMGDFEELWVMVSGVGLVGDEEEGIVEHRFDDPVLLNLTPLTGENAIALWEGYVPEGTYNKVFIYVDEVHGLLPSGEAIEVKLPSDKLQVNAPVTVGDEGEDWLTEYVFDVSIHRAGASGMYILQPQLAESGEGREYRLLEQTEDRVRTGRPEWAGRPDDAGRPEGSGNRNGQDNHGRQDNSDDEGEDDDNGIPGIEVEKEAEATHDGVASTVIITNDSDVEVMVLNITDTVYWQVRGGDWQYLTRTVDDEGYTIAVDESLTREYEIEVDVPEESRELRNEVEVVIEERDRVFRDREGFEPWGYMGEIEFEGTVDGLQPLRVTTDEGITYTVLSDAETETEGNLTLGQPVKVEGVLRSEDTVLADEIEGEGDDD